jgi:hypothetical protein
MIVSWQVTMVVTWNDDKKSTFKGIRVVAQNYQDIEEHGPAHMLARYNGEAKAVEFFSYQMEHGIAVPEGRIEMVLLPKAAYGLQLI